EHLQVELETNHRRNAQDFVCRGRKSRQAPADRFLYALRNSEADAAGNAALFPASECRPGIHEVAENLPHEQRAPVGIAANRARQRELAFIELAADRSAHKLRHPVLIEAAHGNSLDARFAAKIDK